MLTENNEWLKLKEVNKCKSFTNEINFHSMSNLMNN